MIKILDLDAIFDKYIEGYVYENIGKVKPEEIENKMPELYLKFGDEKLDELDGKTPNTYYSSFSGKELVDCLKEHLEKDVAVSDFLCEAITGNKQNESALAEALKSENNDEELILYIMNMLGEMNSNVALDRYLDFIAWDYSEGVKELATELLGAFAEEVKEKAIIGYNESQEDIKPLYTDILSKTKNDDRVFNILIQEFIKHKKEMPLYLAYIIKFGDERALPYLLEAIEDTKINYADFEELRFAIESLGGTYDKVRDFSSDKTYKKIKGIKH